MFGLRTPELIIILIIFLLLFGGAQLPKLAKNLGSSVKELRNGLKDATASSEDKVEEVKQKDSATTKF